MGSPDPLLLPPAERARLAAVDSYHPVLCEGKGTHHQPSGVALGACQVLARGAGGVGFESFGQHLVKQA